MTLKELIEEWRLSPMMPAGPEVEIMERAEILYEELENHDKYIHVDIVRDILDGKS